MAVKWPSRGMYDESGEWGRNLVKSLFDSGIDAALAAPAGLSVCRTIDILRVEVAFSAGIRRRGGDADVTQSRAAAIQPRPSTRR